MSSQHQFNRHLNPLQSSSLTFTPGALSGVLAIPDKAKQEEELTNLKKQMRQKDAEFNKEKAILQQQVELLKMQLCEAGEREINLKKINQSIMDAIKRQEETPKKEKPQQDINEDHPVVHEMMMRLKNEYRQVLQQEKDRHRDMEYNLEKENQQLLFKLHDQERKLELKEQDLQRKIMEMLDIQKKQDENLKSSVERVKADMSITIKQLEMELDTLNSDIDRQVSIRLNDRYLKEQGLNESILKYQREQQQLFTDIKELRKTIESKDNENKGMVDKLKRYEDENGSLKYKMKQQEKKLKEEQDNSKKMKEDLAKSNKRGFLQKSKTKSNSVTQGVNSAREKSRNQGEKKLNNKENQLSNPKFLNEESQVQDEDEEKNKLRRQLSLMRCQIKKLEIELKDQKSKFLKELASLKDKLNVEKKKRMNIYEEKLDKNNQLLQDLLEKDQTIIHLNKQLSKLQEKFQYLNGGHRSYTPNHHLYMSQAHDSGMLNNLGISQVDFNGIQSQSFTSRLMSPMRSLEFPSGMPPLHNSSFNILPQVKNHRNKKGLQISPKQIKRNRVNSFKIPQSNTIYSSQQRFRQSSRDASIAEVNEDLYRDSVESGGHDNVMKNFKKNDIIVPYQQRKMIAQKRSMQDQELQEVLYQQHFQQIQSRKFRQEVYYDSLENESDQDQTYFFKGSTISKQQSTSQYEPSQNCSSQFKPNFPRGGVNTMKRYTSTTTNGNDSLILQSIKQAQRKTDQDDDCMVNILENDNGEQNSSSNNMRQNSSSDNLLSDISKAFENLKQENMKKQSRMNKSGQQKLKNNPVPKPIIPSLMLQKKNEKIMSQSKVELEDLTQSFPKDNSQLMDRQYSEQMNSHMPLSPTNISMNPCIKSDEIDEGCDVSQSPRSNRRLTRNDSCPSPLDETETVLMLGSGQKLRVQDNVGNSNLNMYQNQFKEQKTLQMFSSLNSMGVRQSVQLTQQSSLNNHNKSQGKTGGQILAGMRNRTNSLINSCSSESNFKMKFIRDMPNTGNGEGNKHRRVPSNNIMNASLQLSLQGLLMSQKKK